MTSNLVWELPFGRGKRFGAGNPVVKKIVGGWQLNAVYIYQAWAPISLPNLLATGTSPHLDRSEQTVDRWYNTAAFSIFPAFTVRTLPNFLSSLRNDGQNNWDLSVLKTTAVTRERVRLQFRFEMFNALNRAQFANPTISPGAANNGATAAQANAPRMLQFGLKLLF